MAATTMRIAIGADNAGAKLKNLLKGVLNGDSRVAEAVAGGEAQRGLLVCGTGIGMAISANKVSGIRATVAHDAYSVERSVLSNDCQILALGARVIGPELATKLVREWLSHEFDPGSASAEKVEVIERYEASGSTSQAT